MSLPSSYVPTGGTSHVVNGSNGFYLDNTSRSHVENITRNDTSGLLDISYIDPFSNPWFKYIFILMYSTVFLVCCLGNSVVLYTIARNKRLRTRTNFFLANLAVADLGVGIVCVLPKLIQYLCAWWMLGEAMCKISYFAQNMTYTASILLLTVIAIERYIAVLHPLRSKCIVTETRLVIAQVMIWVISAAYNTPDLHMFDVFNVVDHSSNSTLSFCLPVHDYTMKYYYTINFVLWYILPLSIMTFMYTKVCYTLWLTGKLSSQTSQKALILTPMSHRNSTKQETMLCYEGSNVAIQTKKLNTSSSSVLDAVMKSKNNNNSKIWVTLFCLRGESTDKSSSNISQPCQQPTSHTAVRVTRQISSHRGKRYVCDYPTEGDATSSEDYDMVGPSPTNSRASVRRVKCPYRVHSQRVMSSRRKVIKLLIVVMLTFAVCVLPTHLKCLLLYWEIYPTQDTKYEVLSPLSYVLLYGNSALNPILYWLFSDIFKRSLESRFCCCRD